MTVLCISNVCPSLCSELAVRSLHQPLWFVSSRTTLIQTSPWGYMLRWLFRPALQYYISFRVYVGHFQDPFSSHWVTQLVTTGLWQCSPVWHSVLPSPSAPTQLCDSCSLYQGMTASLPSSANCTGWQHRRGFSSSLLFLCTSVCTGQHHCITANFEARSCLRSASSLSRHWMCIVHGCPPSVISPSLCCCKYLEQCLIMSRPHPLCLFSVVASRISSSGIPSHDFYRNFCSACTVTVVIFGH